MTGGIDSGIDKSIVKRAQTGDRKVWEEIIRETEPGLRFILRKVLSEEDERILNKEIREYINEAYLSAFRDIHAFQERGEGDESSFPLWLYRIGINLVLQDLRKLRGRRVDIISLERNNEGKQLIEVTPSDKRVEWDAISLVGLLERVIRKKRPTYREVLQPYWIEGKSKEQIALEIGITETATEQRLKRGKRILRENLLKEVKYFRRFLWQG